MRFIEITLVKQVEGKPAVEKQVCIVAASIMTMEPEVLRIHDRIIPVTFIQAAQNGMLVALNSTETMDVIRTKVEQALAPMMLVHPAGGVEVVPGPNDAGKTG